MNIAGGMVSVAIELANNEQMEETVPDNRAVF